MFLLFLESRSIVVAFDSKLLLRVCSGNLFLIGSDYDFAVGDTINDLIEHTSEHPLFDYYCEDIHHAKSIYGQEVTLYGHGVCTSSLPQQDCRDCLKYAYLEMMEVCTHSDGARIQLMDCRLRYENYKFNNDE
ncbi:hypothetical protein MLD38_016247 [Melastoma candidum]|uniref:Uncharacterized protein n=1 Tax=Melastoma candidum TaxID=119954 RepID=A0ACB9RJZ8_9MYRT|nr:hypothetical protein MLD38_016247 [Melastoma candidum]